MNTRKWPILAHTLSIPVVGLALIVGFAVSAQAQTCTIANWKGGATNLGSSNVGFQGSNNRRYGGPCGLRVPVEGEKAFVSDNSPNDEETFIARFYVFLNNAGAGPVQLFAADDGEDDQIQVWYENGGIVLSVFEANPNRVDITVPNVGNGWHSVEFEWHAGSAATVALSVNGASDVTEQVNTDGIRIENAHLGNVNGAGTIGSGNSIDFDDYDSRREERPGRLLVGDATGTGGVTTTDYTAVLNEVFGTSFFAPGQPDCNEDGSVTTTDATCILNKIF